MLGERAQRVRPSIQARPPAQSDGQIACVNGTLAPAFPVVCRTLCGFRACWVYGGSGVWSDPTYANCGYTVMVAVDWSGNVLRGRIGRRARAVRRVCAMRIVGYSFGIPF